MTDVDATRRPDRTPRDPAEESSLSREVRRMAVLQRRAVLDRRRRRRRPVRALTV